MNDHIPDRFFAIDQRTQTSLRKVGLISWRENYDLLSEASKKRLRYSYNKNKDLYSFGEPTRNIAGSLYIDALRKSDGGDLIWKFDLLNVICDIDECKKLTIQAKKEGESLDKNWRYLVNLERLNDYRDYASEDSFIKDIKSTWLHKKVVHSWNGDEEEWYRRFEITAREVILRSGVSPAKKLSVDEFIENGDLWATSGSGYDPESVDLKLYNRKRDLVFKPRRNKWSTRWALSNYETKRLLFKKRKQFCKMIQKSEPGKVRAVIASDMSLYLKMSYLAYHIEQVLHGRTDSTLFMTTKQRNELWQKMAPDNTWRMPLDQGEFDRNVTTRQNLIMCSVLKELLIKYCHSDEIIEVCDLVIYAIDGGYVSTENEKIPILNGLMSGWRWTALLGTFVNEIEITMAQRWCEENGPLNCEVLDFNAQGDDDWLKGRSAKGLVGIWLGMESFGLDVNPAKFFLSRTRDEYLRRVLDRNVITGYPARSVASICFRNPINSEDMPGAGRVRNTFQKWKLFCERLDCVFEPASFTFENMIKDCTRGTIGLKRSDVINFINQGILSGGIGYNYRSEKSMITIGDRVEEKERVDILGDGYKNWLEFSSKYGVEEEAAHRFCTNTLDLNVKLKMPKWVKYLYSHDDLSYTNMPYGTEKGLRGTICIGAGSYQYAKAHRLKWFESIEYLRHVTHIVNRIDISSDGGYYNKRMKIPRGIGRIGLEAKKGISVTLANLSSDPELVWDGYSPDLLLHKPKRWQNEFLSGKLKAKVSPVSGWGMDIIGYCGSELLNGAISMFLRHKHPSYELWNTLLVNLNNQIPELLESFRIRVIE